MQDLLGKTLASLSLKDWMKASKPSWKRSLPAALTGKNQIWSWNRHDGQQYILTDE